MLRKFFKRLWTKLTGEVDPYANYYYLQSRRDVNDVREAFLWDGQRKSLPALKLFLKHASYQRVANSRDLIIDGYCVMRVTPYTYIWRDSDGFDSAKLPLVHANWYMYRRAKDSVAPSSEERVIV